MSTERQRHASRRGSAFVEAWRSGVSPVVAPGRGCSGRGSWTHQPGRGRGGISFTYRGTTQPRA
ncbi:uncharacterized protein B0H18DRAFT_1215245 [Fomitopsis serialis]|uniref:uncharacterized protein n=1 Tax=Fomitopsis serialis TaxID=139415 RepID=UPI002008811E|nr:uncharacterized protein B0H18DRAFT_1215245 [Neoantrodia serialis]KAH9915875.1 hypothetical protein B0H18DRAFT_1215245 [Neoantrodia serialis]